MAPLAAISLLVLLQNCSAFLSPVASPASVRVCGWCRHGRSATNVVFSAAEKSSPPESGKVLASAGCGIDLNLRCEGKDGLSAILANYPRSSFSKVGIKPPKRTQSKEEEEVTFDSEGLIRLFQQCEVPKPKATEGAAQCQEVRKEPESPLPLHPKVQSEVHERVTGFLSANPSARWLCAGRVSGAHGLRGFLKIEPATFAKTERFCTRGSRLFFRSRGACTPLVSRAIEEGRLLPKHGRTEIALVKFQGIDDRNAANTLTGSLVYVHAAQSFADLPPKCLLAAELIGFEVTLLHDAERTRIGRITDVISKHDMRLREEALGAADDCLQIEVYKDLPGRRLLLQHFRDPMPPPAPLLASALHALGSDTALHNTSEDAPVLFECEGCGLRFRDCTAAVCHERLCLATTKGSGGSQRKEAAQPEQTDALQWLLQVAVSSAETPDGSENTQTHSSHNVMGISEPGFAGSQNSNVSGLDSPPELQNLDGPSGRSGTRLGHRFLERLSLGSCVSWDREGRFFPRRGEGKEEAAERALAFACNERAGSGYAQANWNDPSDVTAISRHFISPAVVQPAVCDADQRPTTHSLLLPFVLGMTVGDVNTEAKTLGINAPPSLLH